MVSTRSQDPSEPQPIVATEESPVAFQSRKRKARHEADVDSRGPHMKRRRNATATEKGTGAIDPTVNYKTRSGSSVANFLGVLVPGRSEDVTKRAIDVASVEETERPKQGKISKDSQTAMSSNLETDDSLENKVRTIKPTKAIHKRFGSEEMELQPPQLDSKIASEVEENISLQSDEASDDEAPETVTAEAGFKRARAAAANAVKTIERFMLLIRSYLGHV